MPGFWLRLKPRYQWAGGIAIVVIVWVATGQLTGQAKPSKTTDLGQAVGPRQRARRPARRDPTRRDHHRSRPHPGQA